MILPLIAASIVISVIYYAAYLPAQPSNLRSVIKCAGNVLLAMSLLLYSEYPTLGIAMLFFGMTDFVTSRVNWSPILAIGANMIGCFISGLTFLWIIEGSGTQLPAIKIAVIVVVSLVILFMLALNWRLMEEYNIAVLGSGIVIFLLVATGIGLPMQYLPTSFAVVVFLLSSVPFLRETFADTTPEDRIRMRRTTWPLYYVSMLVISLNFLPEVWQELM